MRIKYNRRAVHDYEIVADYEAGLVLQGWEVKSLKAGNFSFADSYILIRGGQAWWRGLTIGNWHTARAKTDEERKRDRKLLLHAGEIAKISNMLSQKRGQTIIPIELLTDRGLLKLKIGIVRSKRKYEKKQAKKLRDLDRDLQRDLKHI